MSHFTRTGLIPAFTSSLTEDNSYQQKTPNVHLNLTIICAPIIFRPFLQDRSYVHPYSNICSILCNHPIADSTTRSFINETKEILKKGKVARRPIQVNYSENDDYNIGTHQEDIFVPEILFRRYIQTDSRPPTPTLTTPLVSKPSNSTFRTRRCITPDEQRSSNAIDRTRLVLDLRKCLSQSGLAVEGKCVELSKEDFSTACNSMVSTAISRKYADDDVADISVTTKRKKKPVLLSSEIAKHKYYSSKKYRKEVKNDILTRKNNTYVLPAEASPKKDSKKSKKSKKKKPDKQKSRKMRKKNLDSEIGDFNENLETEIALNAENKNENNDQNEDNEMSENGLNRSECSEVIGGQLNVNTEYIQALLKEIDSEIFENDILADKYDRFLKQHGLTPGYGHDIELGALQEKYELDIFAGRNQRGSSINVIDRQEVLPSSPTEFSRIISRRNARFELPLDKTELEDMPSLEYLKRYVHVSDTCRPVYNRIFHMYASPPKNHQDPFDVEPISFITKAESLNDALLFAMGNNFQIEEQSDLRRLLSINADDSLKIDVRTWYGICALCERIYGDRLTSKNFGFEDLCHEIEKADFEFLDRKIANLNIHSELKEILFMIRNS